MKSRHGDRRLVRACALVADRRRVLRRHGVAPGAARNAAVRERGSGRRRRADADEGAARAGAVDDVGAHVALRARLPREPHGLLGRDRGENTGRLSWEQTPEKNGREQSLTPLTSTAPMPAFASQKKNRNSRNAKQQ